MRVDEISLAVNLLLASTIKPNHRQIKRSFTHFSPDFAKKANAPS
ncbi:hypothetical protein [Moraxella caviae]|nr:hypothetical protein [Moraxella caviae]